MASYSTVGGVRQVDYMLNQMKMEADIAAVNVAKQRHWLKQVRAEQLEGRLEKGEVEVEVLTVSAEAEEAREGLSTGIWIATVFFEHAKGPATAKCTTEQEDFSPL
ncbi:hypothetical protein PHLCEN_2v1318, partial [Hermanssonia centrifuga]